MEREVHIKIRAEVIKHWHDTRNKGKFINGFCQKQALKLAERDFDNDLKADFMRITTDELLLNSVEDCCVLIENRSKKFVKTLLSITDDNN
jgi:hypothetical protein